MSKWQCSEEQAQAARIAATEAVVHGEKDVERAAITAAVGPTVDELREELSALADQCERILRHDPKPVEFQAQLEMCALPDYVKAARAVLAKTGGGK